MRLPWGAERLHRELLGIAETALGIGRVLMIQKKNNEALKYLDEVKSISEANAFNKERRGVYEALAKLWERAGDLKQALHFQQLYTNLQSQVQGASTTAAVLNLVKKYEKDRSVRDAQIVQASRLKMALLSLLLILPSAALLLIYLRRKRREASLLMAQKRDAAMADKQDQVDNLQSQLDNSQVDANKPKYQNSPMTDDLAEVYTRKLFAIMSKEQPYLDPDFTLDMLAQRMALNPTYLSQLFNQYLKVRFLDFVNDFRIGESQRLLLDSQYSKISVLDIGFQVGFSSKSTFYRAFKILTGMSPADFRVTSSSLPDSSRATLRSPLPLDSSTSGWKPYARRDSPDRRES